MNTPLIEGFKEMLRVIVIAVIPILLTGINAQTGAIAIDWKVVVATGLIALIRFIDKWMHERGKKLLPGIGEPMGILPF